MSEICVCRKAQIVHRHNDPHCQKCGAWWIPKYGSTDPDNPPPLKSTHTKVKTGRNEPCPCGSGVKFKKCCIRKRGLS